jgi:hypothetical protein
MFLLYFVRENIFSYYSAPSTNPLYLLFKAFYLLLGYTYKNILENNLWHTPRIKYLFIWRFVTEYSTAIVKSRKMYVVFKLSVIIIMSTFISVDNFSF